MPGGPPPLERITSWCHDGGTVTVTTPCQGYTPEECATIHQEAVDALMIDFPENC